MMQQQSRTARALIAATLATVSITAVAAAGDAKQPGGPTLSLFGAEKAGNKGTGVWSAQGALGEPGAGIGHQKPHSDSFYSPDVLAGVGVR